MFSRIRVLCMVVMLCTHVAYASESSGTITTGFINAKVCHSVGCVTPAPGVLNFKPTGTTPVTIDDTNGIDGIAWGTELGWVTFDPTGPEGLTINTSTGVISGKAWSQVAGWVNFAPTGQSVTVTSAGEFSGWAWAGGPYGGWIKFDCTDAAACVQTDWRPLGSRTVTTTGGNGPVTGSGGGGGSPSDVCWNIAGIQFDVPLGYTRTGNNCQVTNDPVANTTTGADVCLNIANTQVTVPAGMVRDVGGLCVSAPTSGTDTDGDGIPDAMEQGDSDQDTIPDYLESNSIDTDGDGRPNYIDDDDDGDGYPTRTERTENSDPLHTDFDGDGILSYLDAIFNRRKTSEINSNPQTDASRTPEHGTSTPLGSSQIIPPDQITEDTFPQTDSAFEQLTYPQSREYSQLGNDADRDGIPDNEDPVVAPAGNLQGGDSDGDGIPDAVECSAGYPCVDTDKDGMPDYLQPRYSDIPNVEGEPSKSVVHFSFVPDTMQVPVDLPAFREAFRRVLGTELTQSVLADVSPNAPAQLDLISFAVLVIGSSTVTFATLYTLIRVAGIVLLFL